MPVTRWLLAVTLATSALPASADAPLRLQDVVRQAVEKAQAENARISLAQSQLKLLEAQSKWKLELRPSLGLFSFSNPGLLAASVGSGLLMQRFSAPSALTMRNAQLDLLAAEVDAERVRVEAEIQAGHAFFDLLERQQVAGMLQATIGQRQQHHDQLERMVKAGRVTALEPVAAQMQLLDLEQQFLEVEDQRRVSAIRLATLIGEPERATTLVVEDAVAEKALLQAGIPEVEPLLQEAFAARPEVSLLRKRLQAMEAQLEPGRPVRLESAGGGYAYVNDAGGLVGSGLKGALLGGNTGRTELNLAIPLRKTGEKEAGNAVLAARARLVAIELDRLQQQVRSELLTARSRAMAAQIRRGIARRRLELAEQHAAMITARVAGGLATEQESLQASQRALGARVELTQAGSQEQAARFALRVICGRSPGESKAQIAGIR
ncbi:MAG: TolC family protein [Bryobacterales bacterium]|nr:TolC family protein [Bryobacterales bacterium]